MKNGMKNTILLSTEDFSPLKALYSQFLHGGWVHLIGNMLLLLLCGPFVETKLGKLNYLFLYLLSGVFGLYAEVLNADMIAILGASANVYGVIGAFLVLFWKHKMQILLFYIRTRVIFLPVKYFIPFVYLAGELALYMSGVKTGIGHLAHIGGAFAGILIALSLKEKIGFKYPTIQKEELDYLETISNTTVESSRLQTSIELFSINPFYDENFDFIYDYLVFDKGPISRRQEKRFKNNLLLRAGDLMRDRFNNRKFDDLYLILDKFTKVLPKKKIYNELSPKEIMQLGDHFFKKEDYEKALYAYKFVAKEYRNIPEVKSLKKTIKEIEIYLKGFTYERV